MDFLLSKRLYPKDEIEWMILRCLYCKTEHSIEELLYWTNELIISYGLRDTWMLLYICYGNILYHAYPRFQEYMKEQRLLDEKEYNCYFRMEWEGGEESGSEEEQGDIFHMTDGILHVLYAMYMFDQKLDTILFTMVRLYLHGHDNHGSWNEVSFLSYDPKRENHRDFNLVMSLDKKHIANCMYYASTMNMETWNQKVGDYFREKHNVEEKELPTMMKWFKTFLYMKNWFFPEHQIPIMEFWEGKKLAAPEQIKKWNILCRETYSEGFDRLYMISDDIHQDVYTARNMKERKHWQYYTLQTPYWKKEYEDEEMKIDDEDEKVYPEKSYPYEMKKVISGSMKFVPLWFNGNVELCSLFVEPRNDSCDN